MADLVFIASPLRSDTPEGEESNKQYALDFIKKLWDKKGEIGFAPHLYFTQFLDDHDEEERLAGMECGAHVMRICQRMYVVGPILSEGMEAEIGIAQELEIPIIHVPDPEAFFTDKRASNSLWGLRWLYQKLCSWLPCS